MNRYLERRNYRNRDYRRGRELERDMRNPYGSVGGYVSSSRRAGRRNSMDSRDYRENNNDYAIRRYPMDSRTIEVEGRGRMYYPENDYAMDYESGRNYRNDYREDYAYERDYKGKDDMDEEYKKDLKEWINKLKKKDKYGMSMEQTISQAKSMGVKFEEFTEEEFYATFLAMVSDYQDISNDPTAYLRMAKDFLEDDDIAVSPSEKLCIYLYQIVLGED